MAEVTVVPGSDEEILVDDFFTGRFEEGDEEWESEEESWEEEEEDEDLGQEDHDRADTRPHAVDEQRETFGGEVAGAVVVLDEKPIAGGETAHTTAHLSNAIDDRFTHVPDRVVRMEYGLVKVPVAAEAT